MPVPIGAYIYDQLIRDHSPNLSTLERRSYLKDVSNASKNQMMQQYVSLVIEALKIAFPTIEARVSTRELYVSGQYAYADIREHIATGNLSPYVQPDTSILDLTTRTGSESRDILPIHTLFSSKNLFHVYRDPLVNIFRSTLFEYEA